MIRRLIWMCQTNRIGPDMITTYPLLFFKKSMSWLCKRKLGSFSEGAEVRPGVSISETQNVYIGKNVVLRRGTFIDPGPFEGVKIEIGDNVLVGPNVHMYANNHSFEDISKPICEQGYEKCKSIIINNGAWIGGGVIIFPWVSIGENAVVGAGSVVVKDVPSFTVYAGVPAKKIRDINK